MSKTRLKAQTGCSFFHNADFWQIRNSKVPANAPKLNIILR